MLIILSQGEAGMVFMRALKVVKGQNIDDHGRFQFFIRFAFSALRTEKFGKVIETAFTKIVRIGLHLNIDELTF